MKATIEVPDELYQRVKARAALLGRSVRDVTTELYQQWLSEPAAHRDVNAGSSWIDGWVALGLHTSEGDADGPSAREILMEGRRRLDPTNEP